MTGINSPQEIRERAASIQWKAHRDRIVASVCVPATGLFTWLATTEYVPINHSNFTERGKFAFLVIGVGAAAIDSVIFGLRSNARSQEAAALNGALALHSLQQGPQGPEQAQA
jgi:hypothetical protein